MKLFVFLLFLSLSSLSSQLFAQVNNDTLISFVSKKIASMPNGFVVSIALLKDEEVNYIGLAKENDHLVVKEFKDSLFEIGSLTKVFTSSLLAHEVVNNNLKLRKPINKLFPYKFKDEIKLSYQELANHTSGMYRLPSNILPLIIRNMDNPYSEYSFHLFDKYLQQELQIQQSDFPKYSYSNLGAGLLAYALSIKREEPFENLLSEIIFTQYGMVNTAFDINTSFHGMDAYGQIAENWQFKALKGAGGLISNTSDLSKFVIAQFDSNNCSLSLTRKATHSISDSMSIGLGWHIINPNSSDLKYWHNGGTGGFTSSISFRTLNKTGVIILSNISSLHKRSKIIDELCFQLLDVLE